MAIEFKSSVNKYYKNQYFVYDMTTREAVIYPPKKNHLRSVIPISVKLADKKNLSSKLISENETFKAMLERILLQRKQWEEFLERLRKSGGGGGNLKTIDRIAVSFMLSSFLNNKIMKALIEHFNFEFLKQLMSQAKKNEINIPVLVFTVLLKILTGSKAQNTNSNIITKTLTGSISQLKKEILTLAIAFAFQLNKLKDILQEDFRQTLKKISIRKRLLEFKEVFAEILMEIKDEVLNILELFKDLVMFLHMKIKI